MGAEDREAEAIRLQLVELSEHILRRLAILLSRARAHSRHAYDQVEATARDITNVQREMMEELARPVPRREEIAMLTALMRVQDRSLSILEQLERLPFNDAAAQFRPLGPSVAQPRSPLLDPPEIAPWPDYDEPRREPPPPAVLPATRRLQPGPDPRRSYPPDPPPVQLTPSGRLQTHSSVGQPLAAVAGQAPVRSVRPPPPPVRAKSEPKPRPPAEIAVPAREPIAEAKVSKVSEPVALVPAKPQRASRFSLGAVRRFVDRVWELVVRIPQAVLALVFVSMGLVLVLLLGRMFFVVADGLNTKRADPQVLTKSEERLPPEDKTGQGQRQLVPSTSDAFVVVLSMHPDAASARRTFTELQQRMGAALANVSADIQPMETQNGLRYRLALAPALARDRAFALCNELKNNGFPACWLRRLQR